MPDQKGKTTIRKELADAKKKLKSLGVDKYDEEESIESKRLRLVQKRLAASQDPSLYGTFLANSAELDRFQMTVSVAPLIYISAFLFSHLDRLSNFSSFSKYYVVFWVVYSVVSLLIFSLAHHSYLMSKVLLSMPIEYWPYFKENREDKVHRHRVDHKRALAREWQHRWSDRLLTFGAVISAVGVMVTAWEVWKVIR